MATLQEMIEIAPDYEREFGRMLHYGGSVTDTTSEPVRVPADVEMVTVTAYPGTSAKVQFTNASYDAIKSDTASWLDWSYGEASVGSQESFPGRLTAIRLVSVGTSTWDITA